jgi:hypothetical protein
MSTIDLPLEPLSEMFIINMVAHRLDKETRKAYELQLMPQLYPKGAELLTFLKSRYHILQKTHDQLSTNQQVSGKRRHLVHSTLN